MLPIPFQDHSFLMEVSQTTWCKLLDAARETARLEMNLSLQDLVASFANDPPGPDLFSALELIQELGTPDGREHVEQVAEDQQLTLDESLSDSPAREFIAQLWVQSRTDSALTELLLRAQLTQRSVRSLRPYREFVGQHGTSSTVSINEAVLKEMVSKWCREHQKREVVSVVTQQYNGEWYCHVVRGDPLKRVVEIRDQNVSTLQYRPAATDLIRYDPKTGRIGIATRSPQLLKVYRSVLGTLVGGDERFFGGENVCSLQTLQQQGNELFTKHRVQGISRVDVVEILWRRGDRDKFWVSGRNVFRILDDLQAKLLEGELIEAKLTIAFSGGGRSGHVTLKSPNIIEIRAGRHQALVEQLLDSAGLRGSFNPDGTPRSFWSLYPWRLKEAEWRLRLGTTTFDSLRASGLLRSIKLDAVDHPDHPGVRGSLEVIEISPLTAVGVSADPAIGVRTLTSSDTEGYELDAELLAAQIQKSLALTGSCRELVGGTGQWSLGQRTFAPGLTVAVFLAVREPGPTDASLIADAASGFVPVLIVPQCCVGGVDGIASIGCRLPHGPFDVLLEPIVTRLNWHGQIPPNVWASGDLIIDTGRGKMWYRGIELTKIQFGTHPFKFAEIVAKGRGRIVPTRDVSDALSSARLDNDAAKTAKRDFVKALKASFEAQGVTCPPGDIFPSSGGGYSVKVDARVF